jgi:hypothetical protein
MFITAKLTIWDMDCYLAHFKNSVKKQQQNIRTRMKEMKSQLIL